MHSVQKNLKKKSNLKKVLLIFILNNIDLKINSIINIQAKINY
jgi:hypothetical protein